MTGIEIMALKHLRREVRDLFEESCKSLSKLQHLDANATDEQQAAQGGELKAEHARADAYRICDEKLVYFIHLAENQPNAK